MKVEKSKNNGITLIALVITIIVLLILVAVSIATLTGENGILTRAQDAKNDTEIAEEKEAIGLAYNGAMAKNNGTGVDYQDLNDQFTLNGRKDAHADGANPITVTFDSGRTYTIDSNGNILEQPGTGGGTQTGSLPSIEGETTPYLPGTDFSQVEGTNLEDGLVITDGTNNWVWIEVPKSIYENTTYNGGTAPTGANDYDAIEKTLNNYAGTLVNRDGYTDVWYDGNGNTAEDEEANLNDTTGCGLTYEEYNNLKNTMLSSVYTNGGFWIGQYEAGSSVVRKNKNDTLTIPVVQEGAYPYNYITCSNAQMQTSKMNSGSYTSSLMFGIQWDLVLKQLEVSQKATADELTKNSTNWGNYSNSNFSITKGEYSENFGRTFNPVDGSYEKVKNKGVLLTTGSSEQNKRMNIYDLAGNEYEWTLEKSMGSDGPCTYRGGYCNGTGSEGPASIRYSVNVTDNGAYSIYSFRPALY